MITEFNHVLRKMSNVFNGCFPLKNRQEIKYFESFMFYLSFKHNYERFAIWLSSLYVVIILVYITETFGIVSVKHWLWMKMKKLCISINIPFEMNKVLYLLGYQNCLILYLMWGIHTYRGNVKLHSSLELHLLNWIYFNTSDVWLTL